MSSVATSKTFEAGECSAGEWESGFIRKTGIEEFMERFGKNETVSVFMMDRKRSGGVNAALHSPNQDIAGPGFHLTFAARTVKTLRAVGRVNNT
jgi:hypothetical protein